MIEGNRRVSRRALGFLIGIGTAFACFTSAADAATPISLGPTNGEAPRIVVDSAGTGFMTWSVFDPSQPGNSYIVRYCRLPQGATACATNKDFVFGSNFGGDYGNSPVLASGGRTMVAIGTLNNTPSKYQTYLYNSTDGGVTFGSGTFVGENAIGIEGSVEFMPANGPYVGSPERIITTEGFAGDKYQATPTGFAVTSAFMFAPGSTASNSTTYQTGTHLLEYTTLAFPRQAFFRRYIGPGDFNMSPQWGPATFLTGVGSATADLISGGGSIYFAYTTDAGAIAIRKYGAGSFGDPIEMTGPLSASASYSAVVDTAGIVHLAYIDDEGNLKYRYGRSTANNDFTRPQTIIPNPGNQLEFNTPELAVNAAGNGYITYHTNSGTDVANVIPIAPGEGPVEGGGGGGGSQDVTSPIGGGYEIAFTVPKGCVTAGASFNVSVTLKRIKKGQGKLVAAKKKKKFKIKQVDFSKGNTLVLKDKKKPFEATIVAAASGTFEVSAKVKYTVKTAGKKAKKKKKTLKKTLSVC